MDIETVYLFVGVFVLSSVMLVVLQRLFKNKSYEEVIAEQRQQTNALYSNQQKPKVKDKKQKKALKKSKDKKSSTESTEDVGEETSDQADPAEETAKEEKDTVAVGAPEVHKSSHAHVEFQDATTVIEESNKETKRKQRRESMKPILVNRDSSSELIKDVIEVPMANHFEESHPKDEFELHNAHILHYAKEDRANNEKKKKQQVAAADKKSKHQVNEIISKNEKEKAPEPAVVVVAKEKEKEKEKEPQEVNEEAMSVTVVQNGISAVPVKDKKKKKSELNALTQNNEKSILGVNLAHMITLVRKADMSKQDVQTLIDVLLNKQHDAPSIINEWSEGKGDPIQKLKKQLADKTQLATELQETITGAQNRLREVRADQIQERSQHHATVRELQDRLNVIKHEKLTAEQQMQNLTLKCQQLQEVVNEESNKNRQIVELTVANLQRDVAEVVKQHNVDVQKIMQLQAELEKGRNDIFEMRAKYESILNTEQQKFNNELESWRDQMRNLDINKDSEVKALQKQIEDSNKEVIKMNNDLRLIQEKHAITIHENEKVKEEYTKQANANNSMQQENHKLKEELQKLHEAKTNGSIEMDKQHQIIINQLTTDLKNVKNQLEQNDESNRSQLSTLKKHYDIELEELRNKNNDLRKKNWKVMDALNAAENRVNSSIQSHTQISSNEKLVTQISKEDPKETRTKFLKRLFPSIEVSSELNDEEWDKAVQDAVLNYIVACTTPAPPSPANEPPVAEPVDDSAEVARLKAEISNYEKIIKESEGILCQLQTQVEDEQIRWGRELKLKEDSIVLLSEQLEIKEEELRKKTESLNEKNKDNAVTN